MDPYRIHEMIVEHVEKHSGAAQAAQSQPVHAECAGCRSFAAKVCAGKRP